MTKWIMREHRTIEDAAAQREEFGDALRRLGDQATLVAAEFRALEAQWRKENDG